MHSFQRVLCAMRSLFFSLLKMVPADFVWLIEYLFSEVLVNPSNAEITTDIEKVLGRKPKDFSEYVKEAKATGAWTPKF